MLGAADAIDTVFGAYPTVATALQLPPQDTVTAHDLLERRLAPAIRSPRGTGVAGMAPPPDMPHHGAVIQVHIPPTQSGFSARAAWVYLPPAYLVPRPATAAGPGGARRRAGQSPRLAGRRPAGPADGPVDGGAPGLAPVVVMPDSLGGPAANPLCMDSALGRDDTYLALTSPHG